MLKPYQLDEMLLDLIERMLVVNPADRISLEEALQHPYFDSDNTSTGSLQGLSESGDEIPEEQPIKKSKTEESLVAIESQSVAKFNYIRSTGIPWAKNSAAIVFRNLVFEVIDRECKKNNFSDITRATARDYVDLYMERRTLSVKGKVLSISCLVIASSIHEIYPLPYEAAVKLIPENDGVSLCTYIVDIFSKLEGRLPLM
jgi:serine/threonine protein kinase